MAEEAGCVCESVFKEGGGGEEEMFMDVCCFVFHTMDGL